MTQMNKDFSEILKTVMKQPDSKIVPETTEQVDIVKNVEKSLE